MCSRLLHAGTRKYAPTQMAGPSTLTVSSSKPQLLVCTAARDPCLNEAALATLAALRMCTVTQRSCCTLAVLLDSV